MKTAAQYICTKILGSLFSTAIKNWRTTILSFIILIPGLVKAFEIGDVSTIIKYLSGLILGMLIPDGNSASAPQPSDSDLIAAVTKAVQDSVNQKK